MSSFNTLPMMPKELRPSTSHYNTAPTAPYLTPATSGQRNAAIWSAADDEVLLQARASGLNWQPIASRHFPNKTANACRKRHERLIERRHIEDWDMQKLELLAQEYAACRKEMWEVLASRVGERWAVVEAKCMEKGLKNILSTARTAQRRASAASQSFRSIEELGGISDHNSDSGIGLASDTEMEVGEVVDPPTGHTKSASWHAHPCTQQPTHEHSAQSAEHVRARSLPHPLPLYQPPPPVSQTRRAYGESMTTSPQTMTFGPPVPSNMTYSRYSPGSHARGGISIQSVLSPAEPQRV